MLAISCLSQKGGVGKSTLARLIAQTYASGGWKVKIADFNVKQKTSVDWAATRMSYKVEPEIPAEAFTDVSRALNGASHGLDLVVMDGRPESDTQTLRLAQNSELCIIPTGVSADDLLPQIRFGQELKSRGIDQRKIIYALNKVTDSSAGATEARNYILAAGFKCFETTIPNKQAYINAQNIGRTLAETDFPTLNERSTALANEIISSLQELQPQ